MTTLRASQTLELIEDRGVVDAYDLTCEADSAVTLDEATSHLSGLAQAGLIARLNSYERASSDYYALTNKGRSELSGGGGS